MGVGVSLSGLASAVANEGGIGVISSAGLGLLYKRISSNFLEASIYGLKEEIRLARENSQGILGVNIMVAMSNFVDMVKTAIAEKIDVIFAGAGMPLELPSYLSKGSTTKLVPIVSSARAAKLICTKWLSKYNYLPDAFVVEGPKAGGHLGFKPDQIDDEKFSLENLIPQVILEMKPFEKLFNRKIPVIAAGGIYTGADMYDIMKLGAAGVQMGTIFVTTNECDASDGFKQAYLGAKQEDIGIIKSPVGMPGRAIFNEFLDKVKLGKKQPIRCPFQCIKTCDVSSSPYCIIIALINAVKGNFTGGYAFAGTNAFKATSIISVKETFATLLKEFKEKTNSFK